MWASTKYPRKNDWFSCPRFGSLVFVVNCKGQPLQCFFRDFGHLKQNCEILKSREKGEKVSTPDDGESSSLDEEVEKPHSVEAIIIDAAQIDATVSALITAFTNNGKYSQKH